VKPGDVVVVTGASRGIGRVVAVAAASRGASVGLVARDAEQLATVSASLPGASAWAAADVGDASQLRAAIASLEAELGPTDVLVANAGIGAYGPFVDVTDDEVDALVRVNVLGTVNTVRAVLPGMVERRRGAIVVVASIAGRIGAPFEALYSATKFAQVGLAEALAVEVAPHGIAVAVVNPGPVDTGFFDARGHPYVRPRPRKVAPEVVAAEVVAAVERGRQERTVPRALGAAVAVRHLVPRLYRWGATRTFRRELAEEVARRR
jgi:short-subunit dehydrogenase